MPNLTRSDRRFRRHRRIRQRIKGTAESPRLFVRVTGKHFYVQFIDDIAGHTLASLSTMDPELRKRKVIANCKGAEAVGKVAGARALSAGIKHVVFDRGGFKYHGRIKVIADAIRAAGLKF